MRGRRAKTVEFMAHKLRQRISSRGEDANHAKLEVTGTGRAERSAGCGERAWIEGGRRESEPALSRTGAILTIRPIFQTVEMLK